MIQIFLDEKLPIIRFFLVKKLPAICIFVGFITTLILTKNTSLTELLPFSFVIAGTLIMLFVFLYAMRPERQNEYQSEKQYWSEEKSVNFHLLAARIVIFLMLVVAGIVAPGFLALDSYGVYVSGAYLVGTLTLGESLLGYYKKHTWNR